MIYDNDKEVLIEIIDAYKAKQNIEGSPVDMDEVFYRWSGKEFKENLIKVMYAALSGRDKSLTKRDIDIVLDYHSGCTFQSLGDRFGITKSRTSQIYWKSIYKLAESGVIKQICKGMSQALDEKAQAEAEEEYLIRSELEIKLKELEGISIDLMNCGLSVRDRNLLLRSFGVGTPTIMGLDTLQRFEMSTDVTTLKNCGKKSAHNLIGFFKSVGIDTRNWEDCMLKSKFVQQER